MSLPREDQPGDPVRCIEVDLGDRGVRLELAVSRLGGWVELALWDGDRRVRLGRPTSDPELRGLSRAVEEARRELLAGSSPPLRGV